MNLPVVALIRAKSGQESALASLLQGLVAPTQREAGCLRYELHRSVQDPRLFVFIEEWVTTEALNAHLAAAHIAAAMAHKEALIEHLEIIPLDRLPNTDL